MCIIAAVPAGVPLPDKATRKRMWDKNRDGAGYMTIKNGSLEVRKGFMTFESFEEFVENLDPSQPRVLHYRIGTNGANTPENTHPWVVPYVGFVREAICHNGIISWLADDKNVSDSKRLADMLATDSGDPSSGQPRMYDPLFRELLGRAIGSYNKVVYMNASGLHIINESSGIWDNGVWYSNHGYKEYTAPSVCDPRQQTIWPAIEYDRGHTDSVDPTMRIAKYVPHYDTVMLTDTDGFLYDLSLQEFIANKDDFKYTASLAKKIDSLVEDWHKSAKKHNGALTF